MTTPDPHSCPETLPQVVTKHVNHRRRDVITLEHLSLYPHMYKTLKVEKHPNLAKIISVDLAPNCPPVFDQGQLGSCTANAILGAYEYEMTKQKEPFTDLSRLFLYYQERAKEGTIPSDAGAAIQDGIWVLQNGSGVCRETVWPYVISKFSATPPPAAYADAGSHHVVSAQRLSGTLDDLRQTLVDGNPIVFGVEVYSSFESATSAKTGVIPMPNVAHETLEGGHAICLVGYDDTKQLFKFRNSWGTGWGDRGYGYLPYAYVTNPALSSDFWVITVVKDGTPAPPPPPVPVAPKPTYTSNIPVPAGLVVTF